MSYIQTRILNLIISNSHFLHAENIIKSIKNNKYIFKTYGNKFKRIERNPKRNKWIKQNTSHELNFNRRYSLYSNVIKEKLLNPNSSKSIQININTKTMSVK